VVSNLCLEVNTNQDPEVVTSSHGAIQDQEEEEATNNNTMHLLKKDNTINKRLPKITKGSMSLSPNPNTDSTSKIKRKKAMKITPEVI